MCVFESRVRHQRSSKSAPLGACEPVVSSSCQRQLPREALGYEVSVFSCGKAPGFSLVKIQTKGAGSRQKKKSRPSRACKGSALKSGMALVEKRIFLRWTGLEKAEGSAHNPNIEQKKEGVKNKVKGCGSVNRPTSGSQRPAEPVATGFLEGVKISKNRGQILGLGVKLGVVNAGSSQCGAILYGVRIGVVAVSCFQQGKQSARLSAVHFVRGRTPDPPSFFSAPTQPRPPQKLRC